MNTEELETMMSMLLEGGDVVSVLDPISLELPADEPLPKVPAKKKSVGCSDAKEECCELV